MYYAVVSNSMI